MNIFALKLPTLQSPGFQCVGERQRPARINGSAETVDDDDDDDDDDGGRDDGDGDGDDDYVDGDDDFKFTSRK